MGQRAQEIFAIHVCMSPGVVMLKVFIKNSYFGGPGSHFGKSFVMVVG